MGPGQRWIEVAPPGASTHVLLYPVPEPGADFSEAATASIGKFQTILFHCDDVQKTYEELSARGVTFSTPAKQNHGECGPSSKTRTATASACDNPRVASMA